MIEIHPTVVLLAVEALALLLLVQLVTLVMALLRRRREKKAVAALVTTVKDDTGAREERNGKAIGRALGAQGEALATHVKAIERATKLILQRVVIGWSRRDAQSVQTLPDAIEALNVQWRELLAAAGGGAVAAAPSDDDAARAHAAEIDRLNAEKKIVEDELAITRETMNRMLTEYAAIYERGGQKDESTAGRLLAAQPDTMPPVVAKEAVGEAVATEPAAAAPAARDTPGASQPAPPAATTKPAPVPGTVTVSDEVTEDDLDALFDAHATDGRSGDGPAPGDVGDVGDEMVAGLDIADPFEGLDEKPETTRSDEEPAEPTVTRKAAAG